MKLETLLTAAGCVLAVVFGLAAAILADQADHRRPATIQHEQIWGRE